MFTVHYCSQNINSVVYTSNIHTLFPDRTTFHWCPLPENLDGISFTSAHSYDANCIFRDGILIDGTSNFLSQFIPKMYDSLGRIWIFYCTRHSLHDNGLLTCKRVIGKRICYSIQISPFQFLLEIYYVSINIGAELSLPLDGWLFLNQKISLKCVKYFINHSIFRCEKMWGVFCCIDIITIGRLFPHSILSLSLSLTGAEEHFLSRSLFFYNMDSTTTLSRKCEQKKTIYCQTIDRQISIAYA